MRKQYILYIVVILLSIINIINANNISALSYSNSVGVGFTFNPTLSVSLSSSDLVISNLVPGNTLDSNAINVSVASNATYGYILSANVNNENLVHSNNINTFSSIATNADLSNLEDSEDTNIWGYSYKDNTVETPAWSNYNGLSSSNSTTLINANSNVSSNLDFKIAAKASNAQASGTYTGAINFTAVTKHVPISLAEAYASEGKTMINGFYAMQDMTSTICSKVEAIGAQLQVLDKRDNKLYWISKLADNHCWMTQNLDLDLDSNKTYTHWDTDLGWTVVDEEAEWEPLNSSRTPTTSHAWTESAIYPISYNPGNLYWNGELNAGTSGSIANMMNASGNSHYHIGNYYNWTAAVASNDTSGITSGSMPNSICPSSWKMPSTTNFQSLIQKENLTSGPNGNIQLAPVYFVYSGLINSYVGNYGYVWANSAINTTQSHHLRFTYTETLHPSDWGNRHSPYIVRCLAR